MNDQHSDAAMDLAILPQKLAGILFNLHDIMEQQAPLADFQPEATQFFHRLDGDLRPGFASLEQSILARRND